MDRVYKSGAAGAPPSAAENASAGYPTAGNPGGGVPPTKPGPFWFYMVLEELASIVTYAGIAFDKTVVTQVRDALLAIIGRKRTGRNTCYNGSCRVLAEAAKNLSTSPQYAKVDMWAGWASGGAVTGGTLTRDAAAAIGSYQKALHFSGITLTGAGQLSARQRIPALDAVRLMNQTCSFSATVLHDVGAPVNFTVVLRKPNAADNYSGVTVIGTSGLQAVASAAGTQITFTQAMGDCSAGIEIEIQAAVGAIAAKNLRISDMQLELGSYVTEFENLPLNVERERCGFMYEKSYDQGTDPATATRSGLVNFGQGASSSNTQNGVGWNFRYPKRSSPTMSYWDGVGAASKFSRRSNLTWVDGSGAFTPLAVSENSVLFDSGDTSASAGFIHFSADARL